MFGRVVVLLALGSAAPSSKFVTTNGTRFSVDGRTFRFAGTNNYYLSTQSDENMALDVFETAARSNFSVIRTWAFHDRGFINGTASTGHVDDFWYRALDPSSNQVIVNETGLRKLDVTLVTAATFGIRLIITMSNNWDDYGGIDQSLKWESLINASYSDPLHDDFFDRPWQMQTHVAWMSTLVNRRNSVTGVIYKDDPTIFAWELMNEPRCEGSGYYKSSNKCALVGAKPASLKILPWVATMSAALKALDSNHLIAVGDEGFLCEPYDESRSFYTDCGAGTDFSAFTALPDIDFASMHVYPDNYHFSYEWAVEWVQNHTQLARAAGKPNVVGEFNVRSTNQSAVLRDWTSSFLGGDLAGDLSWMLCGRDSKSPNGWYPFNSDGFCVFCPNASEPVPPSRDPLTCGVLVDHANSMARA